MPVTQRLCQRIFDAMGIVTFHPSSIHSEFFVCSRISGHNLHHTLLFVQHVNVSEF